MEGNKDKIEFTAHLLQNLGFSTETQEPEFFKGTDKQTYCVFLEPQEIQGDIVDKKMSKIDMTEIQQYDVLKAMHRSSKGYILIVPLSSIKKVYCSSITKLCTYWHIEVHYYSMPPSFPKDMTRLKPSINVFLSTSHGKDLNYYQLIEKISQKDEIEGFIELFDNLKSKRVKSLVGFVIYHNDIELNETVLGFIIDNKSLYELKITLTDFEQFEMYLEALEYSKVIRVKIICKTLTWPQKELLWLIKKHIRQFWYREYVFKFENSLKNIELKSHPFLEIDL